MPQTHREMDGNPFPEAGFWTTLREALFGPARRLDCLQVEVTSRCPGRCTYCPHTVLGESWLSRDMALETFSRLWPLMRQSGRVHLQGWGEPLLNPVFFEMVALARRAGCQVSTTTCGLLMDEAIAGRLVESGIDIVAFSLTGTDPSGNAAREGIGFDRVCRAVDLLQKVRRQRMGAHLEIHFAYLLLASNLASLRGLPALMQRLGVHAAVVSTLDYLPDPALAGEAILPHETGKLEAAAALLEEAAAEARRLGLDFHYHLPRGDASGTVCHENIERTLFVSADGWVSPCVYVNVPAGATAERRRVFGNVLTGSPLSILEDEALRRFRDHLAQGNPEAPCRGCPKRLMGS